MTYDPVTRRIDLGLYLDVHVGESCAVLGNGPSLITHDLTRLTCKHIGVNRSWKLIQSTYHVVADIEHLREYFAGQWDTRLLFSWRLPHKKFQAMRTPEKDNKVRWADRHHHDWIVQSKRPWSGFSGIAAVELAVWMGFDPIYLIGYDLHDKEGKFYPTNAGRLGESHASQRKLFEERSACFTKPVQIYNCNEASALTCFPHKSVEEVMSAK